jgi:hypothetical protein
MKQSVRQRKINYLTKVQRVNEIFCEYHEKGYSNEWIFRNQIRDQFLIERGTFYSYLQVPYKKLLAKYNEMEAKDKENLSRQGSLF